MPDGSQMLILYSASLSLVSNMINIGPVDIKDVTFCLHIYTNFHQMD